MPSASGGRWLQRFTKFCSVSSNAELRKLHKHRQHTQLLLRYSQKPTPRLNAKTVNANLRGKHMFSVVADMKFRGVTNPHQVGALRGTILEWENRRGEAQSAESCRGGSWRGSQSPPHSWEHSLGERCKLPQRGPGGAPAAGGFSCILCHQIAPPGTSAVCVELFMPTIAVHFHDSPYIHLGGIVRPRGHGPLGPHADAPMRLCIYSPLFRRTACFSVIP